MIQRSKENDVPTQGYLIRKHGRPEPITIPPHTNFVHFLRHMYAEHGSGKLYLPRQITTWGNNDPGLSNWEVVLWGGGRQKASKIKVMDVRKYNVPKSLKLIEMVSP